MDVTDRDVEEIGLQYFNSIPKVEQSKSLKNYADLLVEDVGDNDAVVDSKKLNDMGLNERIGNDTDRGHNVENQPYLPATLTETINGANGCSPVQQSPQTRRLSPNPTRTSVSRVKSIFMETASSLLPILYSSSSSSAAAAGGSGGGASVVRTDYTSSVQHRVSTKNHVNLEEPNCDDSFLSGVSATRFLSPDENRLKTKNKELLKTTLGGLGIVQGQEEYSLPVQEYSLPVQDFDDGRDRYGGGGGGGGGSLNHPPEKWKQRRFSATPTPTSPPPVNYKSSTSTNSNSNIDEFKTKYNQIKEVENNNGNNNNYNNNHNNSSMGYENIKSVRYAGSKFPIDNENKTIRFKRKTQTRSGAIDPRDSDDNSSKSESDDVTINKSDKSDVIVQTPGHNLGPNSNSTNNQMPILVPQKQKSLTPLMDKVNSNYRDNYQRSGGGDNNNYDKNMYTRIESETIAEVINFDSHKPHAPLGVREPQPQGENFRGLQMQKILSSVQNAQLQKEVDALQRQLAQLEELEGSKIFLYLTSTFTCFHLFFRNIFFY